jgi:HK97 gp10 family phage protein
MTDGFLEVQKALSKLAPTIQEKVVVGATRAAAKVVADEAKSRVPVDTGLLKKSIGVAKAKKKDTPKDVVKFYVVPKSKIKFTTKGTMDGKAVKVKTNTSAFHAHFIEFGTEKMAARPFLRPAMESTRTEVVTAFQKYALKRVDKEVAKLGRR